VARKEESIEELARREASVEAELAKSRAESLARSQQLAKEVPARFFALCTELRQAVMRFNAAGAPEKRFQWRESAALAARDSNLNADFNCALSRPGAEITMVLNQMGRAGKPDVYLIEVTGVLKDEGFFLRCEGQVRNGRVDYRLSLDLKRLELTIDKLAERLVIAAAKQDISVLKQD